MYRKGDAIIMKDLAATVTGYVTEELWKSILILQDGLMQQLYLFFHPESEL